MTLTDYANELLRSLTTENIMDCRPKPVHSEIHHCFCVEASLLTGCPVSDWAQQSYILRQAYSWKMRNSCDRQLSLKDFLRPWWTFLRTALQSKTLLPQFPSFLPLSFHLEPDLHHSLTTPCFPTSTSNKFLARLIPSWYLHLPWSITHFLKI